MKTGEFYKTSDDRMIYEIEYVGDRSMLVREAYPDGEIEIRMISRIQFESDIASGELVEISGEDSGKV